MSKTKPSCTFSSVGQTTAQQVNHEDSTLYLCDEGQGANGEGKEGVLLVETSQRTPLGYDPVRVVPTPSLWKMLGSLPSKNLEEGRVLSTRNKKYKLSEVRADLRETFGEQGQGSGQE